MKKTLAAICLLPHFLSHSSSDYIIDINACAGTEYIYDLHGKLVKYRPEMHNFIDEKTLVIYKNEINIPLVKFGNGASTTLYIENTSEIDTEFFYQAKYYLDSSGEKSSISTEVYSGKFSNSNNPKSPLGATLPQFTTARIIVEAADELHFGSATIKWQSCDCLLAPPILASTEVSFGFNNKDSSSIYYLNDGKPW